MAKALTINDLKSTIESLFKDVDNTSIITLGTVHATKGLERDVVYLITNTFNESNQEEKNICYVAKTRSKSELYYLIKEKDSKKQKSAQIDE
jgi:ATP-dependent exoDNAse (exonuclease V) beta subunit